MPFSLQDFALVDSQTLSRYFWGVDDAAADSDIALTVQQKTSIELTVNAISRQIMKHLSFDVKQATYTEVWDGAGSDELVPTAYPVMGVTSVKFASSGDFSGATQMPAELVFFDKYAIKLRSARFPVGRGLVQVVYTAGYATIPEDIQLATILQFQWAYKQIGKGDVMVGIKQIAKSHESQVKDTDIAQFGLRAEVVGLLAPYKRFEAPLSIMFNRVC